MTIKHMWVCRSIAFGKVLSDAETRNLSSFGKDSFLDRPYCKMTVSIFINAC